MCATCGCGDHHEHHHEYAEHGHGHGHDHDHNQERRVRVEREILTQNAQFAADNRQWFADSGVFAINLVSSPGSGKTTLLTRTLEQLRGAFPLAVIGGDQHTSHDAQRIQAVGVPALQINTGKGCHLDAHGVGHALEQLPLPEGGVLFIENVGNLVCPADFDLGEMRKVVVLSVTEGEDKPLKYANMFAAAHWMLLNKIDLLPHLDFDVGLCLEYARRVNPHLQVLQLSARTGEGLDTWLDWLRQGQKQALADQVLRLEAKLATVRARIAQPRPA